MGWAPKMWLGIKHRGGKLGGHCAGAGGREARGAPGSGNGSGLWGWQGVRQGHQRSSPAPHLPVSSVAQPVPVWSPGCRAGSPTSPVLEGDLRAPGDREPGGVRHGASRPSRPSWLLCYPAAVVPAPRAGRAPVLPHARCPQPRCCCSCGLIGPNPRPQDVGHLLQQAPAGATRCPGLTISRTPYWLSTLARSCTKHCSMRSWKGRKSSVTFRLWIRIPSANSGVCRRGGCGSGWDRGAPRARAAGGVPQAVPARRSGPSACRCSPGPRGAPSGMTPGRRPAASPAQSRWWLPRAQGGAGALCSVPTPRAPARGSTRTSSVLTVSYLAKPPMTAGSTMPLSSMERGLTGRLGSFWCRLISLRIFSFVFIMVSMAFSSGEMMFCTQGRGGQQLPGLQPCPPQPRGLHISPRGPPRSPSSLWH